MSDSYNPPPDYEKIEQKLWKKAQEDLNEEVRVKSERLLKRVKTFTYRFGYKESSTLEKIDNDEMFAAHFAKEPRRTSLHESLAAKWIKSLPWVESFCTLPKSGRSALKISSDGNIESENDTRRLPGKSLDFQWRTGETVFFAMHKYTKEGGGNQDSQYKEMLDLMTRFLQCKQKGVVLLVIVDGPYYLGRKLEELKGQQSNKIPKSYALPIDELPALLITYKTELEDWKDL